MKDFITKLIDEIIDDWEDNKAPFRLVMISSVKCYMCNKYKTTSDNLRSRYTDDFQGLFNKKGWSYCKDCEYKVDLAEKFYYKHQDYLTYNQTNFLRDADFNFLRVSSNKSIKPYVQESASVLRCSGNSIIRSNNRLLVPITWRSDFNEYQKMIYFSNLIYFNSKFFGKFFNQKPNDKISDKWQDYIKNEYDYSNSWNILLFILDKKNIPNGLIREICFYWGGFN